MTNWDRYDLTEMPFLGIPAINIDSDDPRANGQFFLQEIAETEFNSLRKMIATDLFPAVFLRSPATVLGNGKSAVLASVYWNLDKQHRNVIWATATDNPLIRDLLTRILDSFVSREKIKKIREGLGRIEVGNMQKVLSAYGRRPPQSTLSALVDLLNAPDEQVAKTYAYIRRKVPSQNHADLFGALLHLAYAVKESRFYIFIDQFEEFIRAHRTTSLQLKLAGELNDLMRSIGEDTTLVASLHPEAQDILRESAPEVETFLKVQESSVELSPMDEEKSCKLIAFYLKAYRAKGFRGDVLAPFSDHIVKYAAHRTSMNVRDLMLALRSGLIHGVLNGYPPLDGRFVKKYHNQMFGGLEDKFDDYVQGKFRYRIE